MIALEQSIIDSIYKLRKEKGLTQKDLAKVLGVSTSFVGNVENRNNPSKYSIKHIDIVAKYFKISPYELFI
jgi:transcriptional regulator with XRE-family HTH domain